MLYLSFKEEEDLDTSELLIIAIIEEKIDCKTEIRVYATWK